MTGSSDDVTRVAVITGGGGGLGGAVARLLAEADGHRLALVDNRAEALEPVLADVRARGVEAEALIANLGSAAEAESVVPRTIERFGRVDILVNAAAILHRQTFDAVTPRDFDDVFHINTLAPYLLCRAAMPDMTSRGWGRIVNVTSTGVYEGGFTMTSAVYEASKGAVAVLTKMLSRHGAPDGILVNTGLPGRDAHPDAPGGDLAGARGQGRARDDPAAAPGRACGGRPDHRLAGQRPEHLRHRRRVRHHRRHRPALARPDAIDTRSRRCPSWNARSWSSALNTAASLHLAAASHNVQVTELKPLPSPMQHQLARQPIEQVDGWVVPPDGPGLGVEVDEGVVRSSASSTPIKRHHHDHRLHAMHPSLAVLRSIGVGTPQPKGRSLDAVEWRRSPRLGLGTHIDSPIWVDHWS